MMQNRLVFFLDSVIPMIPIRDNIPSGTTPVVNYVILIVCSIAFLIQWTSGSSGGKIVEQFGMIPARISHPDTQIIVEQPVQRLTPLGIQVGTIRRELEPSIIPAWMTLLTCMFLHGGWMHFLGNMWFLYIFGDNVEDRLGHVGYSLLYLGTGVAAGLSHYITATDSVIPTIGASGAIAGVMGTYALLYPHAKVLAVIPIFIILQPLVVPAPIFLGIWFLFQTFSGVTSIAGGAAGGIAWWAHIGGFAAGAFVALLVRKTSLGHEAVTERRF